MDNVINFNTFTTKRIMKAIIERRQHIQNLRAECALHPEYCTPELCEHLFERLEQSIQREMEILERLLTTMAVSNYDN